MLNKFKHKLLTQKKTIFKRTIAGTLVTAMFLTGGAFSTDVVNSKYVLNYEYSRIMQPTNYATDRGCYTYNLYGNNQKQTSYTVVFSL